MTCKNCLHSEVCKSSAKLMSKFVYYDPNDTSPCPFYRDSSSEWIPVTERLPDRFHPVLVCREKQKGVAIVEQGYKDVGDWWKVYGTRIKSVTHWRELPDPPKEAKHETD